MNLPFANVQFLAYSKKSASPQRSNTIPLLIDSGSNVSLIQMQYFDNFLSTYWNMLTVNRPLKSNQNVLFQQLQPLNN